MAGDNTRIGRRWEGGESRRLKSYPGLVRRATKDLTGGVT